MYEKIKDILKISKDRYMHSAPDSVLLEITKFCNKKCSFCYSDFSLQDHEDNYLSIKQITDVAKFLAEKQIKNVVLSGGEPLTFPLLQQLLSIFSEYSFNITIITNGILLTTDYLNLLMRYGCFVKYSFDMDDENSYAPLELIRQLNYQDRAVVTLVYYKQDINHFFYNIEQIHSKYGFTIELNNAVGTGSLSIDGETLKRMLDASKRAIELNLKAGYKISGHSTLALINSYFQMKSIKSFNCSICKLIKVDIYGNIYPCPLFCNEGNIIGNIFNFNDKSFIEQSFFYKQNLFERVEATECKHCKWKYLCGGGCMVSMEFKNPSNINPHSCYINKGVFEYLDSIFHLYASS